MKSRNNLFFYSVASILYSSRSHRELTSRILWSDVTAGVNVPPATSRGPLLLNSSRTASAHSFPPIFSKALPERDTELWCWAQAVTVTDF